MRGPRLKKIRRLGTPLPGLTRKTTENTNPPGQHGGNPKRRKRSRYALQLDEKQKVRWHYGVSETQLRNAFRAASAEPGNTGENLLARLERRLDNVVFRLGFAPTIPAARQLVGHGHVRVDGRRVDRPSYMVERGSSIDLSEKARRIPDVQAAVERGPEVKLPQFLALDPGDKFSGKVIAQPTRADVPLVLDETAIVEFYAR
ncbi:MAG TPA: 30S ribosomal protein S4 [Longimicrobiales bacterium]